VVSLTATRTEPHSTIARIVLSSWLRWNFGPGWWRKLLAIVLLAAMAFGLFVAGQVLFVGKSVESIPTWARAIQVIAQVAMVLSALFTRLPQQAFLQTVWPYLRRTKRVALRISLDFRWFAFLVALAILCQDAPGLVVALGLRVVRYHAAGPASSVSSIRCRSQNTWVGGLSVKRFALAVMGDRAAFVSWAMAYLAAVLAVTARATGWPAELNSVESVWPLLVESVTVILVSASLLDITSAALSFKPVNGKQTCWSHVVNKFSP
jgi:hypothetical protein